MNRLLLLLLFPAPLLAATEGGAVPRPVTPVVDTAMGGHFVQVTLGLMVVLLTIWGVAFLVRRMGLMRMSGEGRLRVIGGLSVGTRERVVLLQVGSQQLLLGVTPGSVTTLHLLEQPLETPAADTAMPGSVFAQRLQQILKGKSAT